MTSTAFLVGFYNSIPTYHNITKISSCQGDDFITGCLIDYLYFKENYSLISIDLIKNEHLMQSQKKCSKLIFTGNTDPVVNITLFFTTEEVKETIMDFSQETEKLLETFSTSYLLELV